jgi:hypothetical protein
MDGSVCYGQGGEEVVTVGAARKLVRVRVARWSGVCPVCRAPILGGQQVASVRRGPWVHVGHVIAAGRARRAS